MTSTESHETSSTKSPVTTSAKSCGPSGTLYALTTTWYTPGDGASISTCRKARGRAAVRSLPSGEATGGGGSAVPAGNTSHYVRMVCCAPCHGMRPVHAAIDALSHEPTCSTVFSRSGTRLLSNCRFPRHNSLQPPRTNHCFAAVSTDSGARPYCGRAWGVSTRTAGGRK